jgi:hypothetical protein
MAVSIKPSNRERLLLNNLILTSVDYQVMDNDNAFSNRNPLFIRNIHPTQMRLKFVGRYGNEMDISCAIETPEEAEKINEFINGCNTHGPTGHHYNLIIESVVDHSVDQIIVELPVKDHKPAKTRCQALEIT